ASTITITAVSGSGTVVDTSGDTINGTITVSQKGSGTTNATYYATGKITVSAEADAKRLTTTGKCTINQNGSQLKSDSGAWYSPDASIDATEITMSNGYVDITATSNS
ncbi:MAG: hypothetical protein IJX13_03720, partial [Clostridia bacterium]|nr:hypothetical protein [Clostridia bacterium]